MSQNRRQNNDCNNDSFLYTVVVVGSAYSSAGGNVQGGNVRLPPK